MASDMALNILPPVDAHHESARERCARRLSTLGRKHVVSRVLPQRRNCGLQTHGSAVCTSHFACRGPGGAERMALTGIESGASHRAGAQHFQEEQ